MEGSNRMRNISQPYIPPWPVTLHKLYAEFKCGPACLSFECFKGRNILSFMCMDHRPQNTLLRS
jgi:hypothetical protein